MDLGGVAADVNWLWVVVAAASFFVAGGLWFGGLFVHAWQSAANLSDEQVRADTGRVFAVAAAAAVVITVVLALFIGSDAGLGVGASAGALAGLGWVVPSLAMTHAFERRPVKLTLIVSGYLVVAFTLAGGLIGALA